MACSVRTKDSFELKEGRFRLDIKKKVFTICVVKHQNKLPGVGVNVLSL